MGYKNLTNGKLWQQLFDCPTFSINIIDDADGASPLCYVLLWMSASKVACVVLGLPRACFCDKTDGLETEVSAGDDCLLRLYHNNPNNNCKTA